MTAQYLRLVVKLRRVEDHDLRWFVNFNRDMRQPFESLQRGVIEGRATLRHVAYHRNDRSKVAGPKTPNMQVNQLIARRFDSRAHLVLYRGARTHVKTESPRCRAPDRKTSWR